MAAFLSIFPRYEVVVFIALVRASYLSILALISVYGSKIRIIISPIFYYQIREIEIVDRTRPIAASFRFRVLVKFQALNVTQYIVYSVPREASSELAIYPVCRAIQTIYLFFVIRQLIRILRIGANIFITSSSILLKTGDQKKLDHIFTQCFTVVFRHRNLRIQTLPHASALTW